MDLIVVGLDQSAAQFVSAAVAAGDRVSAYLPLPGDLRPGAEFAAAKRIDDIDSLASLTADCLLLAGDPANREERFKTLLRLAPADMAAVLPLADRPDPLYELALLEGEARFLVVPLREEWPHPVLERLSKLIEQPEPGALRWLEWSGPLEPAPSSGRYQDGWTWIAALGGEIATVSATGSGSSLQDTSQVVISAQSVNGLLATIRLTRQDSPRRHLHFELAGGSIDCELPDGFTGPARVAWRLGDRTGSETIAVAPLGQRWLEQWRRRSPCDCKTWWTAATRAAEIAEAVETSLRRQRAIAVATGAVSEESAFKSIMTSLGCGALVAITGLLALAAAGVPYVDLLTLPLLGVFLLLQLLLLVVRRNR